MVTMGVFSWASSKVTSMMSLLAVTYFCATVPSVRVPVLHRLVHFNAQQMLHLVFFLVKIK